MHNSTNPKVHNENSFKLQYVAVCGGPSQSFTDFIRLGRRSQEEPRKQRTAKAMQGNQKREKGTQEQPGSPLKMENAARCPKQLNKGDTTRAVPRGIVLCRCEAAAK